MKNIQFLLLLVILAGISSASPAEPQEAGDFSVRLIFNKVQYFSDTEYFAEYVAEREARYETRSQTIDPIERAVINTERFTIDYTIEIINNGTSQLDLKAFLGTPKSYFAPRFLWQFHEIQATFTTSTSDSKKWSVAFYKVLKCSLQSYDISVKPKDKFAINMSFISRGVDYLSSPITKFRGGGEFYKISDENFVTKYTKYTNVIVFDRRDMSWTSQKEPSPSTLPPPTPTTPIKEDDPTKDDTSVPSK